MPLKQVTNLSVDLCEPPLRPRKYHRILGPRPAPEPSPLVVHVSFFDLGLGSVHISFIDLELGSWLGGADVSLRRYPLGEDLMHK